MPGFSSVLYQNASLHHLQNYLVPLNANQSSKKMSILLVRIRVAVTRLLSRPWSCWLLLWDGSSQMGQSEGSISGPGLPVLSVLG